MSEQPAGAPETHPGETSPQDAPSQPSQPSRPPQTPRPPQVRQEVTHLPPPSGAHWGLMVFGLAALLVGVAVVANQVAGFEVRTVTTAGPTALLAVGLVCAAIGVIGMVSRKR